ncbi:CBS domain-containing protein [Archaeoglobus sp.]
MKVKDVMIKSVIYLELPSTRDRLLEVLKEYKISAVPVLKNGKLVGIVTIKDILKKIEENQLALLMTENPVTVKPNDSIKKVVEIFLKNPFRRLPVVEKDKLVGFLTVRDLIKKIAEMNIDKPVRDYMCDKVVCVWYGMPLNVCGEVMRLSGSELCPVLDDNAKLVGLVDENIMLNESLIEEFIEKTQYSSSSDVDDEWSWEGTRDYVTKFFEVSVLRLPKEPVKNFMKKSAHVYPQTSVSKCAKEMIKNDIDHIPVLDHTDRICGIVKDKSLIKVLHEI